MCTERLCLGSEKGRRGPAIASERCKSGAACKASQSTISTAAFGVSSIIIINCTTKGWLLTIHARAPTVTRYRSCCASYVFRLYLGAQVSSNTCGIQCTISQVLKVSMFNVQHSRVSSTDFNITVDRSQRVLISAGLNVF